MHRGERSATEEGREEDARDVSDSVSDSVNVNDGEAFETEKNAENNATPHSRKRGGTWRRCSDGNK